MCQVLTMSWRIILPLFSYMWMICFVLYFSPTVSHPPFFTNQASLHKSLFFYFIITGRLEPVHMCPLFYIVLPSF